MNNGKDYKITWVGLLEIRDKKILMVREHGKKLLQLPGGGKEENESDLDTLKREVEEELSINVKNPKLYTEFILPGRNENVNIKFVIYTANIPEKLPSGLDISDIFWIDSSYKNKGLDIGNPTRIILVDKLKNEGLIN